MAGLDASKITNKNDMYMKGLTRAQVAAGAKENGLSASQIERILKRYDRYANTVSNKDKQDQLKNNMPPTLQDAVQRADKEERRWQTRQDNVEKEARPSEKKMRKESKERKQFADSVTPVKKAPATPAKPRPKKRLPEKYRGAKDTGTHAQPGGTDWQQDAYITHRAKMMRRIEGDAKKNRSDDRHPGTGKSFTQKPSRKTTKGYNDSRADVATKTIAKAIGDTRSWDQMVSDRIANQKIEDENR